MKNALKSKKCCDMSMAASYWQERFESGEQDAADIQQEFQDMLRGIQMYLAHSYERNAAHLSSVYDDGCVSVSRYNGHEYGGGKPVLILIPSLINKAHIFDLTEARSMLRYFCDEGVDAYLLDWGDFLHDPDMQDMDAVVLRKMREAISALAAMTGDDVHALGYCMGGSLLAGLSAVDDAHLKSCIFMATPWDFHAGSQEMLNRVKFWSPSLMGSLQTDGQMKVDWLQILFSSLYPEQAMKKFARFSKMDMDTNDARVFVAVEDWLNDGVPLSVGVASAAVKDWFIGNAPVCGGWALGGITVDTGAIKIPSFVVASSADRLVEHDSAKALYAGIKGAAIYDPKCGHVGMIAGGDAINNVWLPICDWVKKNHE